MRRLVIVGIAALALTLALLTPATASAVPAVEATRTARGDTVLFDNTPQTAELSLSNSGWVSFAPRLNASGVLACPPAGDYGYAKNQATNAYGQTLVWEFWVGFYGLCDSYTGRVRFRMRLSCSGNIATPWCNFDSDNAALLEKRCAPNENCTVHVVGNKNFHSVLGKREAWFTGVWQRMGLNTSYMSSDNHFHVHFRNPDHQGVDHAGCSHWTQFPNRLVSLSAPCRYA
jgi:hypothetical protein